MMKERTPKTPASSRSIVRNHSPYCESTGPIVQEGFVAARIRALQGFSNQAQIVTRSHSPITPCPPRRLHIYKPRSPSRPPLALKPVLTGTDMPGTGTVKRFHTDFFSKDHRHLVSASGGSNRSSNVTSFFQPHEYQSCVEPTTLSRPYTGGRAAENPSPKLFTDTISSPRAQRNQDRITAPSTPHGPLSGVDQVDNEPVKNTWPSEEAILSPHPIQTDLVEPRAIWHGLPQTEDPNNDYSHEQALKPRGSIADKLGSMVERGWVAADTFGKVYHDDEFAPHTTESKFHIRNSRNNSRSDSLSEMLRLKKVPSYSGSASVSAAEARSESRHSTRQDTPPHVNQKKPSPSVYLGGSQKRRQRQPKCSPAGNPTKRSSSDSGVHYLKTEVATPTETRRAWTLHHVSSSASNRSEIQQEASPTIWPSYTWDHRSSERDHESTKLPPPREGSTPKSGFDLTMLRDEQLRQDPAAPETVVGSRRSSSNTSNSRRSASRSTSFFRKFPWYKVALVDKQPVVQDPSRGGRGTDRSSRSARAAQHDHTLTKIEPLRGISKSHTLIEDGHEEDENAPWTKILPNQGPIDQQAMDAITPYQKASSQPSLQLMASPQEMSEWQSLEQTRRAPERPQNSDAASLKITEEWLSRNPHAAVKDVIRHAQSPTRTGPFGTQPRVLSQSGSMDASFESPISGDVLPSLQPQWPKVKEHSRMQPYTSSHADSTKLHADNKAEQGSSSSSIARPAQQFAASPNPSHQLRSKVVNLSPKDSGIWTDSLPASVHRSDQHGPVRQEFKGRGKGIKKIQVTVTFDGAEDLVIEATLKKKDRQEHWRTTA